KTHAIPLAMRLLPPPACVRFLELLNPPCDHVRHGQAQRLGEIFEPRLEVLCGTKIDLYLRRGLRPVPLLWRQASTALGFHPRLRLLEVRVGALEAVLEQPEIVGALVLTHWPRPPSPAWPLWRERAPRGLWPRRPSWQASSPPARVPRFRRRRPCRGRGSPRQPTYQRSWT